MRFERAVNRAKVLNALAAFNENITYEAKQLTENPEDGYVLQYYKGRYVGVAAY